MGNGPSLRNTRFDIWQLPDFVSSEHAYPNALSWYQRDGRSIVDTTDGGAPTVFPRLTLEEALAAP
jgi:hypothetical protein